VTAPAKPRQKTKSDAANQPEKQAIAPDDLPPDAWVLPWIVWVVVALRDLGMEMFDAAAC
jgi:hypothetical protein